MSETGETPVEGRELWLVDGYNVLHAGMLEPDRSGFWQRPQRQRLLDLAGALAAAGAEVVIAFDGPHPLEDTAGASPASARAVFAPDADAWLLARLQREPTPSRVRLVTRDRRLAARARSRGVRVVSPRSFLARCRDDA